MQRLGETGCGARGLAPRFRLARIAPRGERLEPRDRGDNLRRCFCAAAARVLLQKPASAFGFHDGGFDALEVVGVKSFGSDSKPGSDSDSRLSKEMRDLPQTQGQPSASLRGSRALRWT